jgi:hypothetical protein
MNPQRASYSVPVTGHSRQPSTSPGIIISARTLIVFSKIFVPQLNNATGLQNRGHIF